MTKMLTLDQRNYSWVQPDFGVMTSLRAKALPLPVPHERTSSYGSMRTIRDEGSSPCFLSITFWVDKGLVRVSSLMSAITTRCAYHMRVGMGKIKGGFKAGTCVAL